MTNIKRQSEITPEMAISARGAMTQDEAAGLLHVKARTIRNYENGTSSMRKNDYDLLLSHPRNVDAPPTKKKT
jgi:DNA-binding transcriptional regulator YiaG